MMRQGARVCYSVDVDTEMRTTRCYKFIHISVIAMLLGTLGAKLVARSPSTDRTWSSDFRSAVLHGVVTEKQYHRLFP